MKVVIAVIKPFKIEEVTEALNTLGIPGVTITEVRGHGRQKGHTEIYRGAEYRIEYIPKIRLEIVAPDDQIDGIVDTVVEHARTGTIGDGKYWVVPVERAGRIRTGELDDDSL
jgi:nitrogen regulatory protein PII